MFIRHLLKYEYDYSIFKNNLIPKYNELSSENKRICYFHHCPLHLVFEIYFGNEFFVLVKWKLPSAPTMLKTM